MKKHTIGLILPMLISSCSLVSSPDAIQTSASGNISHSPENNNIIYKGRLTLGPDTQTFIPCGSRTQYAVLLTPAQFQNLRTEIQYPYQEIYAEISGHLVTPEKLGSAFDYTAALNAHSINYVSKDAVFECSQAAQNTQATGRKPDWSAELTPNLQIIIPTQAKIPGGPATLDITSTQRRYHSDQGTLTLTHQWCRLGNTSPLYGWVAKWTDTTHSYLGCGRLGNRDPSAAFFGTYEAHSTTEVNFSVTLQLLSDHSARTTYSYNDGSQPIIETGFWQQLDTNRLQVIMTRHQLQYLLSERIFNVAGQQLHTDTETINHNTFSIANGGLTLFKAANETN